VISIFLIFHMALPLIISEIPYIKNNFKINRLSLLIGSIFPDLIDKPLSIMEISSGRGFSHSLFFVFIYFLVLLALTKGDKSISVPFFIGCLFHLALDMPSIPLFYPFVYYDFSILKDPIGHWWIILLTNPIIQATELIGAAIFIFIIWNNKLFSFRDIINYIKTNSIHSNKD